jgi:uncharacterized membrane protein
MLPEVFVVKDNYGEDLHRMNTVFKCYASGFLLAPGAALLLPLALATRRARKTVRVLLALFFLGALASPAGAVLKAWKEGGNRGVRGVDGLAFMAREFPGDRAAVAWLQKNAPPGAVVAEVPGVGYEDRARIGTLGPAHRARLGEPPARLAGQRRDAGDRRAPERSPHLYTTTLEPALMDVVRYGIRYVIVGPLEKEGPSEKRSAQDQAYGENAFALRGKFKPVFEEQGTAIYEMPIFERSGTSPANAPPKVQGVQ